MANAIAKIKEETLDAVSKRIKALEANGEIHFPPDYSPQNALKSAWLILQETKDKDKNLALEVCTKASILNSLMDMLITGMNPAKDQGYFIVYGKQLAFQRSYFGSMALAKRVDENIEDIVAEPVYVADTLEYEIVRGKKQIVKHTQTLEAVNSRKVKAAYCIVIGKNGEIMKTDLLTFEEIKKAWAMSKMYPVEKDGSIKKGSVHDEFMADMCRKTVINHACKPIINSSNDKHLKIAAMRSEVVAAEEESLTQIEDHANRDIIDIDVDEEPEGNKQPDPGPEDNGPKYSPLVQEFINLRTGDLKNRTGLEYTILKRKNDILLAPKEDQDAIREKFFKLYPDRKDYPLDKFANRPPSSASTPGPKPIAEPVPVPCPRDDIPFKGTDGNVRSDICQSQCLFSGECDALKEALQRSNPENGKTKYVTCPKDNKKYALAVCEHKCKKFADCDTAQDAINESIAAAQVAAQAETGAKTGTVAGGPEF